MRIWAPTKQVIHAEEIPIQMSAASGGAEAIGSRISTGKSFDFACVGMDLSKEASPVRRPVSPRKEAGAG